MDFIYDLLRLLYLVNLCHGEFNWNCGAASIDYRAECFCGNVTITRDESQDDGINCCGRSTCTITEDGTATCPEGMICQTWGTWPCGDLQISGDNTCQCGAENITFNDWWSSSYKFCCPSSTSQCSLTQEGNGNCDGTVKTGRETGCSSGVCYNRHKFACKSGAPS